jgi:hypothetical protein
MTGRNEVVERRKNARFHAPKHACVALRSDYVRLGHIERISMDGLEFRYVADMGPLSEPWELDIFFAGTAFYLYKVPFAAISDCETVNDTPFPSLPIRRCGVQFKELTPNQKNMLKYLIQEYTIREGHEGLDHTLNC